MHQAIFIQMKISLPKYAYFNLINHFKFFSLRMHKGIPAEYDGLYYNLLPVADGIAGEVGTIFRK